MLDAPKPVLVRPMRPEEADLVKTMARRIFSLLKALFFSLTEHVLVAEVEGQPAGGLVLDVFHIPGERKGGVALWLFVDPMFRSQGIGQALIEASLAFFDAQGCTDIFASVEGYNTDSARRFAKAGLGILSPGAQLARYGIGLLTVWYRTLHFMDIGHLLWARPPAERPDKPGTQWLGALLMNAALVALALWRQHGYRLPPLALAGLGALLVVVLMGARTLAMVAVARALGLRLRYRAWESGFPLGVAIAALFGGYYPNPGGLYPADEDWRYRDLIPKLGPAALAGVCSTLLLLGALRVAAHWGGQPQPPAWHALGIWLGASLAIMDLIPFFPLQSYNGRRIWDWKPWLWLLTALALVGLLALA